MSLGVLSKQEKSIKVSKAGRFLKLFELNSKIISIHIRRKAIAKSRKRMCIQINGPGSFTAFICKNYFPLRTNHGRMTIVFDAIAILSHAINTHDITQIFDGSGFQ